MNKGSVWVAECLKKAQEMLQQVLGGSLLDLLGCRKSLTNFPSQTVTRSLTERKLESSCRNRACKENRRMMTGRSVRSSRILETNNRYKEGQESCPGP